jgi:hypothetical protein
VTDHVDQVGRLLAEAECLSDGPARVAIVQQAAEIADSHNDLELAFGVRKSLLGVCLEADECELMLVTFTWCLAQHDRDPERFPADLILWPFRWVVSSLPTFPQVARAKIEEMKADMAARYTRAGASLRAYHLMCRKMAVDMGDTAAAVAADREFRKSPPDWQSDGVTTEQGFEITYRLFRREYAKALAAAGPFLTRQIRSDHFEGQACADALLPLLSAGRAADAIPYHRRGYKLRRNKIRHLDSVAKHIGFLALTDNLATAVRLFEKHLPQAIQTSNAFNRLRFLIDSFPLLDRLAKTPKDNKRLRRPPGCSVEGNGDRVSVRDLRIWLRELAADLARTFDTRNGNTYFTERLAAVPRLQRWFSPCPLTR